MPTTSETVDEHTQKLTELEKRLIDVENAVVAISKILKRAINDA
jgi:hypothetical protein